MEINALRKQITEAVAVAFEMVKAVKMTDVQKEKQYKLLKQSPDYHIVLRRQILAELRVENLGYYSSELPWVHDMVQNLVDRIPTQMILDDYSEDNTQENDLASLVYNLVSRLHIGPDAYNLSELNTKGKRERVINELLSQHVHVVRFLQLLNNKELLRRVFDSTIEINIGPRLFTLFSVIEPQIYDLEDLSVYQMKSLETWNDILSRIETINSSGYFQSKATHIMSRTKRCDRQHLFLQYEDHAHILSFFAQLKPVGDYMDRLSEDALKFMSKKPIYWPIHCGSGYHTQLMHRLEIYGVGTGNACTCSRDYNSLVKPKIEHMDILMRTVLEYFQSSPITAAALLSYLSHDTGYGEGMNCPQNYSNGDWERMSLYRLKNIFANEKVKNVFRDLNDVERIFQYLARLDIQTNKFVYWLEKENSLRETWVDKTGGNIEHTIIDPWLQEKDNEVYWTTQTIEEEV